jgi:hypothetical protein
MNLPFDKSKVFYPYVMNYLITHHGIIDAGSRYLYKRINDLKKKGHSLENVIRISEAEPKGIEFVSRIYNENLIPTLQIGDLSLKSGIKESIELSADSITEEFVGNHPLIMEQYSLSTSMLIISAYELSPKIDDLTDELWNFFSHCRNACAHGGKFNIIRKGTKMFPAKWHNLEITIDLNGTNIFANATQKGLLWPADPIYLLADIEKKYF